MGSYHSNGLYMGEPSNAAYSYDFRFCVDPPLTVCLIYETLRISMIVVHPACQKEVEALSELIRGDLADALAKLDVGLKLSMPLSRPMSSIGKGVHELRLKDRSGIYRVFYALVVSGRVYVLHSFKKTKGQTPEKVKKIVRKRLLQYR